MNTSITDNSPLKDEQWAIKSFRPLLKALHVQNIPSPPAFTLLYVADYRHLVIQGMGHCIIIIERRVLPQGVGGMLITSYNKRNNFFQLHIFFQDLLLSKELFEEYFTKETIENCCRMIYENDPVSMGEFLRTICEKIVNDKALKVEFVISRIIDNIMPYYVEYKKAIYQ